MRDLAISGFDFSVLFLRVSSGDPLLNLFFICIDLCPSVDGFFAFPGAAS